MRIFIFFIALNIHFQLYSVIYFSHLSNAWYPVKNRQLHKKIEYLEQVVVQNFSVNLNPDEIQAILVPHASYDYSGVVATAAYKALEKNKFKRIFIIAPTHYLTFQSVAVPDIQQYQKFGNDIGLVNLDVKLLKKLLNDSSSLFTINQKAYDLEHSIEIQIPLIQTYCPTCSIIPLLIGDLNEEQIIQVAHVLRSFIDKQTLFIFSSDLTHFGASFSYVPFKKNIPENLTLLDQSIVQSIAHFDKKQFGNILHKTQATVCGSIPIKLLLTLFENSDLQAYVACYDRSSHEKNPDHSVSYASMIFSHQKKDSLPLQDQFTGYEKWILKKLAWSTLQNLLSGSNNSNSCKIDYILTDALYDHSGVFVTLYDKNKELRGCIGSIKSDQPLCELLCDMTKDAALHDMRFKPLTSSEIPNLRFEISILTHPQTIDNYHSIRLGIDGIILKYKNKSALFLPQVALEQGWNLEKTLEELSLKAGLQKDAYKKKDTGFEIFQTIKIDSNYDLGL